MLHTSDVIKSLENSTVFCHYENGKEHLENQEYIIFRKSDHIGKRTVNINDFVKVKLNQKGKEIYFHLYDDARRNMVENKGYYPEYLQPRYPKVDTDGYSKFQLWEFMQIYGECMVMGTDLPFETNLVFE